MQPPSPIAGYLAALSREFSFDRPLSRRVRREVEDHLLESAERAGGEASLDAQRQAIASFGAPDEIASRYATQSLTRQASRAGTFDLLAIAGLFVAMKARDATLGLATWQAGAPLRTLSAIGTFIDHAAVLAALGLGVAGVRAHSAAGADHRLAELTAATFAAACVLSAAATAALLVAVLAGDAALTARLRLAGDAVVAVPAGPALSIAVEIGLAAGLGYHAVRLLRNAAPVDPTPGMVDSA